MSEVYSSDKIIEALKATNGLVSLAAKKLRCSPRTIYRRAEKVARVQQAIDDCRDELVDIGELALRSAITNKEPWAVALVLKTLGKKRGYGEQVEHDGEIVLKVVYGDGE